MPAAPPTGLRLAELAARTGSALEGDGETLIDSVGTLEGGGRGSIAFLANAKYRAQLASTRASAVIVSPADAPASPLPKLVAPDPYAVYAKVANLLYPAMPPEPGTHPSAVVDPSARIAADAHIGAHAVVGARAEIGPRASIGACCVVGEDADIGEDVRLAASVVLYARTRIGARSIVHSGAVIGADGFGMAEEGGRWIKIPQVGRVVIGADCEIGANTTIDRGAIGDTVLEDDVKLDNQIQVGHNCFIGRHTAIAGCVGIAGSAHIGRNCRIGGAAMIAGHLEIADGTLISGGTSVTDSIREPGAYTSVFPFLPHREWQQVAVQLRRLGSLGARLRALEKLIRRDQE